VLEVLGHDVVSDARLVGEVRHLCRPTSHTRTQTNDTTDLVLVVRLGGHVGETSPHDVLDFRCGGSVDETLSLLRCDCARMMSEHSPTSYLVLHAHRLGVPVGHQERRVCAIEHT
jgi:hypothetical protein